MSRSSNLLLTSSGIHDSPTLLPALEARVAGLHTAAIITTASREHKEQSKHAVATREALHGLGFGRVDFVDVEFENPEILKRHHVVYIVGGHPFYLMHHLRRSGADAILRNISEAGETLIIGSSAGAVVLGPNLRIVEAFDPDLAIGYEDFTGVGIVPFTILPHVNRWREKLPDLEQRLRSFTADTGLQVELLGDGESLFIEQR